MISEASQITDFVDSHILDSEDPEEQALLTLDSSYSELARLQNLKTHIESLKESGLPTDTNEASFFLETVSMTVGKSESAADLGMGNIIQSALLNDPESSISKYLGAGTQLMQALPPQAKAGLHIAMGNKEMETSNNYKALAMRKSQINPLAVRDVTQDAAETSTLAAPLMKNVAGVLDISKPESLSNLTRAIGSVPGSHS